jgi:hypothetical protein
MIKSKMREGGKFDGSLRKVRGFAMGKSSMGVWGKIKRSLGENRSKLRWNFDGNFNATQTTLEPSKSPKVPSRIPQIPRNLIKLPRISKSPQFSHDTSETMTKFAAFPIVPAENWISSLNVDSRKHQRNRELTQFLSSSPLAQMIYYPWRWCIQAIQTSAMAVRYRKLITFALSKARCD